MKTHHRYLLSLGAGLLACTPSIEDYPRELEEAYCAWQHDCHQYARERDCVDALALERDPQYDYLLAAVDAGNVKYDRESAASCLDEIRDRECVYDGEDEEEPSACDEVFRGRIGRNGPCMSTAECAGNAVCGFDPRCTDMCCVGACRVLADPLEIGDPCSFSSDCGSAGYCAFDPMTGNSTECTALVEAGGDCSQGQPCAEGTGCDGSECRAVELRGAGEPCGGEFVACEEGRCRSENDGDPPVCVVEAELGAPCDPQVGCERFDTYCDEASGLCTLLPAPGQACADFQCLPYATCQGGEYVEGEGAEGTFKDGSCVALAGAGAACGVGGGDGDDRGCLGDLECFEGRCAFPEVEPGGVCPVPDAG